MRNPMTRRLPRELRSGFGKYAVIFLFVTGMIAFVSGYLVASHSMTAAYNESFEKYNIEDGNLEFSALPDDDTLDEIADGKLTFYENFYKDEETAEVDSTLRIFKKRTEVNLEDLMDGAFPEKADEVAIDRLYASNNGLSIGDTLTVDHKALRITGLVALTDYSALYQSPSDMMFDANRFGVSVVTPECFESLRDTHLHYSYAWIYKNKPADDKEAKERSEDFLEDIRDILTEKAKTEAEAFVTDAIARGENPADLKMPDPLTIENYIPEYANQAIIFTGNDIGDDAMAFTVFLYILIAIIAFVSAVTTSNTITQEATVIGTLRASGYSSGELLRHYMIMPALITLVGALIGNVLGYSLLKEYMASVYYQSYSLTTYKTLWNAQAFIETTVVPVALMLLINYIVIRSKMRLSPLKFMRGDLSTSKRKKAFRLNTKMPILHRFRLRVLFQNIPSYVILFLGIFLANFILLFGVMFKPMLEGMADNITSHMLAPYQYVLKDAEDTDNKTAEKYCTDTLRTQPGRLKDEDVSVYGFEENSKYAPCKLYEDGAVISNCYAEKFRISTGDTVTLDKRYSDETYSFTVKEVVYYPAGLAIFLPVDSFRETFDLDDDDYTGYFAKEKLTDLDDDNILMCITPDDLTKTSRQLISSMETVANIFKYFGIVMFVLLIYLLSKVIIERNSQAISMTKILGFTNGEINGLYIMATTVVAVLSFAVTIPLCDSLMETVLHVAMSSFPGWFEYNSEPKLMVLMFVLGIASYAIVAALLMYKIRRIPMSDALKTQE